MNLQLQIWNGKAYRTTDRNAAMVEALARLGAMFDRHAAPDWREGLP